MIKEMDSILMRIRLKKFINVYFKTLEVKHEIVVENIQTNVLQNYLKRTFSKLDITVSRRVLTAIFFVRTICTFFSVVAFLVLCDAFFTVFASKLLEITRCAFTSILFRLVRLITAVKITITFFVFCYTKASTALVISLLARTIV